MSKITINDKTYVGDSITITNGTVTIDGVRQDGDALSGVVEIKITEGILGSLITNASVKCGDVIGYVDAGGSVQCGNVDGNVDAGGSVQCGNVSGNIDAGGSVSHG